MTTISPSQQTALRLIAQGDAGRAHYTSRHVLRTKGLAQFINHDWVLTDRGRAWLAALDFKEPVSCGCGDSYCGDCAGAR